MEIFLLARAFLNCLYFLLKMVSGVISHGLRPLELGWNITYVLWFQLAQIADQLSHAEGYNVLPRDFGASQFFVKLMLLCEYQNYIVKTTKLSSCCLLKTF